MDVLPAVQHRVFDPEIVDTLARMRELAMTRPRDFALVLMPIVKALLDRIDTYED